MPLSLHAGRAEELVGFVPTAVMLALTTLFFVSRTCDSSRKHFTRNSLQWPFQPAAGVYLPEERPASDGQSFLFFPSLVSLFCFTCLCFVGQCVPSV